MVHFRIGRIQLPDTCESAFMVNHELPRSSRLRPIRKIPTLIKNSSTDDKSNE